MQTIDLISFLQNYYGITHQKLSFRRLSHEDVIELFPFVRTCNKRDVTIEKITCGDIIGVYDNHKKIVYYHNPHIKIDIVEDSIIEEVEMDSKIRFSIDEIENLSKEELLHLRRKLRLNNQRKESYMINSLIKQIKRKEPRIYRDKKEKVLIKERMNYDEY